MVGQIVRTGTAPSKYFLLCIDVERSLIYITQMWDRHFKRRRQKVEKIIPLIALFLVVAITGCATMGLQQTALRGIPREDIVDVRMEVLLERAFVRSSSSYGGGAVAMVLLVGPFSMNVMKLYGTIEQKHEDGKYRSAGTFNKQLKWGENFFNIRAPKNSEIKLMLRAGGTREGMTDIGYVSVGSEKFQTVVVRLTEAGVDIQ